MLSYQNIDFFSKILHEMREKNLKSIEMSYLIVKSL